MPDPRSTSDPDRPNFSVRLLRANGDSWQHDCRIRAALGLPLAPLDSPALLRGKRGKPILPDTTPDQPRRFFNISHCDEWVALAQSHTGQVGIDIEPLDLALDISLIATPRNLNPTELDWLYELPGANQSGGFLLLWTRKEALLKAIGLGIACSLNRVPALPPVVRGWRLRSFVTTNLVLSIAMRDRPLHDALIRIDGAREVQEVTP